MKISSITKGELNVKNKEKKQREKNKKNKKEKNDSMKKMQHKNKIGEETREVSTEIKDIQSEFKMQKLKKYGGRALWFLPAGICFLLAATASASYWTDTIKLDAGVDTLDVGISYESNDLTLDTEKFIPGDSKDIDFTVNNSGDISVDIKPVITITADCDMKKSASSFILTDDDGNDVNDFSITYYDENEKEIEITKIESGEAYRAIKYTMDDEITLAGSVQNDEDDETVNKKAFSYKLKLSENTKNDFIGATAEVNVSTYAIQHRNRSDGTEEWIKNAETIQKENAG